ncbi:non-muscle caldesmon isoform X2 [Carassius carassius]|uniref:non-muscle caldesmon isoform X2 n=1 Tax=Carassius carassius TaxID=217509 RepID=UPI0028687800|nr:non-muscle caldesmon isoform X2 [Carassius carassius]
MSSALVRRSSSKQGLQNLLRVTAQRSIEDAEEIERERRRRAREAFCKQQNLSGSAGSPQDSVNPPGTGLYESELKPSCPIAVDEDEGFSDWTQKLERRTRSRMDENGSGEQTQQEEKDVKARSRQSEKSSFTTSIQYQQIQDRDEEERRPEEKRSADRRTETRERVSSQRPEEWHDDMRGSKSRQQEINPPMENKIKEEKKELKVSYTAKVFLQQDRTPNGNAEEVTSHLVKTKRSPRTVDINQAFETKKDMQAGLETELKLEKIRPSHQEKESQEMEQLWQRPAETELEELKKKREEQRKARQKEELRREDKEQKKLTKKEEDKRQMKEDIERRRMEAVEKRTMNLNITSTDGDDPFNPLNPISPAFKITERTESLNRSLKKSNSFKKTQRPVLLPKIDDKLEQYTHAVEISSKEAKMTKSALVDMPNVSAPVASKKSLFEVGEASSQNSPKGTPLKDTDCVKVGVANLINHWVKGSPEGGNRHFLSTPSDVKPGDVLQKKNMWEIIGEGSSTERSGLGGKASSLGKQYKFVVTGHGKYEKI